MGDSSVNDSNLNMTGEVGGYVSMSLAIVALHKGISLGEVHVIALSFHVMHNFFALLIVFWVDEKVLDQLGWSPTVDLGTWVLLQIAVNNAKFHNKITQIATEDECILSAAIFIPHFSSFSQSRQ